MNTPNFQHLSEIAKRVRRDILTSTSAAQSGHPTSSLSAVELMVALLFGGWFRFDLDNPKYHNNDRLIFSKGHASPLYYALWVAAGFIDSQKLQTLRQIDSPLEGHPTHEFPLTEVPTGSLGQGLSAGAGMAMAAQLDSLPYRTFVLLGDSELAEGSNWEAMELAAYYKLHNLIGILDVNRLGQRGETMFGHDLDNYRNKIEAFGWRTYLLDGHDWQQIFAAYEQIEVDSEKPLMIIAKTIKGRGVSLWEDREGWHSKSLNQAQLDQALQEIGEVEETTGGIAKPEKVAQQTSPLSPIAVKNYATDELIATKKAAANAFVQLLPQHPETIVLDAEVSNSTHLDLVKKNYPDNFREMFIAEQNMVGMALGLAHQGKIPIVSTFAAFMTRAFDQIRMGGQAQEHIIYLGSYTGVSIGKDGGSQMGLEDIAMFRSVIGSTVLYPSDAYSTEKLVQRAVGHSGTIYLRTTREPTPLLYSSDEEFQIGGSKVVRQSANDQVTVVAAGITLHQALQAYQKLQAENISIRVIDLYSVKPVDVAALEKAASETKALLVVEDHYPEGGIAEVVRTALSRSSVQIRSLAVRKMPHSGEPEKVLQYEQIDASAIVQEVRDMLA